MTLGKIKSYVKSPLEKAKKKKKIRVGPNKMQSSESHGHSKPARPSSSARQREHVTQGAPTTRSLLCSQTQMPLLSFQAPLVPHLG